MVFVPLKVTSCYRAWRMGGVQHVLMSPEAVQHVTTLIRTPLKHFANVSPTHTGTPTHTVTNITEQHPAPSPEQPSISRLPEQVSVSISHPNTPAHPLEVMPSSDARRAPKVSSNAANATNATLSEDLIPIDKLAYKQWPEPWQQRLAASANKPLVVWSYAALRQDFGGQSNAARTAIIRDIYAGMGLRKGSHVLWPMQLADDVAPRPDIFREAMTLLQPRVLVFLYDAVPDGLGITPLTCYQSAYPTSLSGLTVVLGPAMEKLVSNASETLVPNASTLSPLLHIINQLLGILPEGVRVR